jgi:hypothetical protein
MPSLFKSLWLEARGPTRRLSFRPDDFRQPERPDAAVGAPEGVARQTFPIAKMRAR